MFLFVVVVEKNGKFITDQVLQFFYMITYETKQVMFEFCWCLSEG